MDSFQALHQPRWFCAHDQLAERDLDAAVSCTCNGAALLHASVTALFELLRWHVAKSSLQL